MLNARPLVSVYLWSNHERHCQIYVAGRVASMDTGPGCVFLEVQHGTNRRVKVEHHISDERIEDEYHAIWSVHT